MVRLRRSLCQLLYNFFCAFLKPKDIILIHSSSSNSFGNLSCIEKFLKKKQVAFTKINRNRTLYNIWKLARGRVVCIDQTTQLTSNIVLRSSTKLIQIWHAGGAYKKVAFDASNGSKDDIARIRRIHGQTDYIIVSDSSLVPIYANAFNLPSRSVLPFGIPRTDKYFSCERQKRSSRVVLFAPTFRTQGKGGRFNIYTKEKISQLQKKLNDSGYSLAIRFHPSLGMSGFDNIQDWSLMPLQEALQRSSVIITDYSSIIFDFCLFPGRTFWLLEDFESYALERGVYFNPLDKYPDYAATTIDDLVNKISSSTKQNNYIIRNEFMSSCDGNATQRIVEFVINLLK